jgi:hypothetical protein
MAGMTPEEYLQFVRDEIACVTMDSKIDKTRVSLTPITKLLQQAPPELLRDPSFGKYVTLLQMQAMMGKKEYRLPEPLRSGSKTSLHALVGEESRLRPLIISVMPRLALRDLLKT